MPQPSKSEATKKTPPLYTGGQGGYGLLASVLALLILFAIDGLPLMKNVFEIDLDGVYYPPSPPL